MSRVLKRILGAGTNGAWLNPDEFNLTGGFQPLKDDTELLLLGAIQRNVFAGGGMIDIDASATGTFDLPGWLPIEIDNQNNQLSGFTDPYSAVLVVQFRFLLRVSDAAINITPKIYDITATALATQSGAVACSATSEDYSGSNQQQTVTLTLPNAKHTFKPQITIAGTVAPTLTVRGVALFDCYISS
jgi:hypothetical protein